MYNIKHHMKEFKMRDEGDMADLNALLNNPLNTVVNKQTISLTNETYNNGKKDRSWQEVVCVVEWNSKEMIC